ncbi:MAG: YidH family protein [Candidatus Xenobiia bacterium LiM19]
MTEQPYSQFTEDELIVRDKLALSRTLLANERTVLAYIRTALAFVVAGLTFFHFFTSLLYRVIAALFVIAGVILFILIPLRYSRIRKNIAAQCASMDEKARESAGESESRDTDS